jgi:hypothetical protein
LFAEAYDEVEELEFAARGDEHNRKMAALELDRIKLIVRLMGLTAVNEEQS